MKSLTAATKRRLRLTAAVFSALVLVSMQCRAEITEKLDSSEFGTYQYEMGGKPSSQDLDSNGTADFTETINNNGASAVEDGTLSITSTNIADAAYYMSDDGAARAWKVMNPTLASGFTVEIRMRVNSQNDPNSGAIQLSASPFGSSADVSLRIGTNFVKWGDAVISTLISQTSNSDAFHIYRLAMEGGQTAGSERFTVWRDGVLLSTNLSDTLPTYDMNRLYFGDDSTGAKAGDVDIDYLRFTSGAYAPVVTRWQMDSADFPKRFEMDVAAGEVDPAGSTAEWAMTSKGDVSALLNSGQLQIDTSVAITNTAYWTSSTWSGASTPLSGYTVEARVRVDESVAASPKDGVFMISTGNGGCFGVMGVGMNKTYWQNMDIVLDTNCNSNGMHVFRIAYDPQGGDNGYQVWRDGIQIGTNLTRYGTSKDDVFWFGDGGGSYGGKGAIDYVRWTMGTYEPVPPLRGTLISLY